MARASDGLMRGTNVPSGPVRKTVRKTPPAQQKNPVSLQQNASERAPATNSTDTSDFALVSALLDGDSQAGETLVERSYKLVFRSLIKLTGDEDLALDLTQETFRRAWASLRTYRGQSTFSSWLYRVAHNVHLNHLRKPRLVQPANHASPHEENAQPQVADQSEGPDAASRRRESEHRLRTAVTLLPDRQRLAISARFWGELSTTEIAALEQVSVVAIRKRIRNALANLRQTIGTDLSPLNTISRDGGTSS